MTVSEEKRQRIREKIAASQERLERQELEERGDENEFTAKAKEYGREAKSFAREHPVLTVAGGLAAGVIIAALLKPQTARALGRKALIYGAAATEGAKLYGNRAYDKAGDVGSAAADRAGDFGDTIADRAGDFASEAERIGQAAIDNARQTTRALFEKVRR